MNTQSLTRPIFISIITVFLVISFSSCDIPTGNPDFSFESSVRAPLILDQTFQLMGSEASEHYALIDTTTDGLDSLFTVGPSQGISIVQEQAFDDFGDFDNLLADVGGDIPETNIAAEIGELGSQAFSANFASTVGIITMPGLDLLTDQNFPVAALGASTDPLDLNPAGLGFDDESSDLLSFNGAFESGTLTSSSGESINAILVTLDNNTAFNITDVTRVNGSIPRVQLKTQDGTIVAEAPFAGGSHILPGASAIATIDMSDKLMVSDPVYTFFIGTDDPGNALISADEFDISITTTQLDFAEATTTIPGPNTINASQPAIELDGEDQFSGLIVSEGELTITINNSLPFDATIDQIILRNLDAVGDTPANYTPVNVTNILVPANTEVITVVPMDGEIMGKRLAVDITSTTAGSPDTPVAMNQDAGLSISVEGSVSIQSILFIPKGEVFATGGEFEFNTDDVAFDAQDYIEFDDGLLEIVNLRNGMGINLDTLQLNLSAFRVAPYTPADTLSIKFLTGAAKQPDLYIFPGVVSKVTQEPVEIPMAGLRLYPGTGAINYSVRAVSEIVADGGTPRTIDANEQITATFRASNLTVGSVSATIDPIAVDLSYDEGGDGLFDVNNDEEAKITEIDGLDAVTDLVDGFAVVGTELALNLQTNLGVDAVFYAVILGRSDGGDDIFLSGLAENSVSSSDTMAEKFTYNGAPVDPSNLIKFTLDAVTSGEVELRALTMNASNSTVDEFLSSLPSEIRFVGRALVNPTGGRVQISSGLELGATFAVRIPLNVPVNGFSIDVDSVEADLEALADLTDPEGDNPVTVESAGLKLSYTNGLPIELGIRLILVDSDFNPLGFSLPATGEPAYTIAAPVLDGSGYTTTGQSGELDINLSLDDLRELANGAGFNIQVTLKPEGQTVASLRATDTITISLEGDIAVQVNVSTDN